MAAQGNSLHTHPPTGLGKLPRKQYICLPGHLHFACLQCSVTYGSGSSDPYNYITDPDSSHLMAIVHKHNF